MFYYVYNCKFEYTKNHLRKEVYYKHSMIFRCLLGYNRID